MVDSTTRNPAGRPARISYLFMVLLLVLVIWLHLAPMTLACLFAYLALTRLTIPKPGGKWLAVLLFLIAVSCIAYGVRHFARVAMKQLPEIADRSIPSVITWAKQRGIDLPFNDYDSLKEVALETVKSQTNYLGSAAKIAKTATTNLLFLVAGCVVAISLFLTPRFDLGRVGGQGNDLYSQVCAELGKRFDLLYRSFLIVMGAQIVISAINTVLTAIFVFAVGLPYSVVVIGVTFFCGLLPVVGNLISNTVIVMIGFTVSPEMALGALVFLVAIHKLEYFLNSKIVGWRIRNPLWLTLLGLIVGERLMGVPGMVLAPVLLHYVKIETSTELAAKSSTPSDDSNQYEDGGPSSSSQPPEPQPAAREH